MLTNVEKIQWVVEDSQEQGNIDVIVALAKSGDIPLDDVIEALIRNKTWGFIPHDYLAHFNNEWIIGDISISYNIANFRKFLRVSLSYVISGKKLFRLTQKVPLNPNAVNNFKNCLELGLETGYDTFFFMMKHAINSHYKNKPWTKLNKEISERNESLHIRAN